MTEESKVTISEDKIKVRNFKDGSSHWWCNFAHYYLNESNELIWCSGETDKPELREAVLSFIKRNKKSYRMREKSPLNDENAPQVKSYDEVLRFGKHAGKSVEEVMIIDKKWLVWCRDNYSFNSAQEKLKQEITDILKK